MWHTWIALIAAALLATAIAKLPIGYYTLLRIVVFIVSVTIVAHDYRTVGVNVWVVLIGLMGIVFNPILPIHLHSRSAWIPLNIAGAVLFVVYAVISMRRPRGYHQ